MNGLPIDTWIRLIDWMSIGLVVYFAYSYVHSHLGRSAAENSEVDATRAEMAYHPPFAAIVGAGLTIPLTVFQIWYFSPGSSWLEYAVRLLPGSSLAALSICSCTANRTRARLAASVRSTGLLLSVANLIIWAAITYWFFAHYQEFYHGAG